MIGAIGGDIIGSIYEAHPIKTKEFPLFDPRCTFTDDIVAHDRLQCRAHASLQ